MLRTIENNMEIGEYVFVYTTSHIPDPIYINELTSENIWKWNDGSDGTVKTAFDNLLIVRKLLKICLYDLILIYSK